MGQADKTAMDEKIAAGQENERKKKRRERKEKFKKEKTSFLTDFKKFITKGNVLDMAVAVVVANAFNAIVTGLVKNVITPFVTYLTSGVSINEWKWVLRPAVEATETTEAVTEISVMYGLWLQSIVDFLIIAFTVFVFVRVVTNMQKKMNWREEERKADAAAKKKAADDAAAAAAAEKAAALAKREEEYYQNVKAQADLLKDIKELLENN